MAGRNANKPSEETSPSIFLLISFSFCLQLFSANAVATDTIFGGQMLGQTDTIVSAGGIFELGFFLPTNCSSYYVGIWYKNVPGKTAVWIANRDYKITCSSPSLAINGDGNLVILDGRVIYMVSNISLGHNASAILLDSGNLVLRDGNSSVLWQSFDYPSNTFLPGMKIGYNKKTGKVWSFTSWKSSEDPGLGPVSMKLDPKTHQLVIMCENRTVWSSGVWNGKSFSSDHEMRLNNIYKFSYFEDVAQAYFTYTSNDNSTISRLLLDVSGKIMGLSWLNSSRSWNLFWSRPSNSECDYYSYCGSFSSCNNQTAPICHCLYGFRPNSTGDWMMNRFRGGCVRITPLQCDDISSVNNKKDKFFKMEDVRFPHKPQVLGTQSIETCRVTCLSRCSCSAYAYNGSCLVWEGALLNLQQLSKKDPDGRTLYFKLAASELQSSTGNKRPWWIPVLLVVALLVFLLASGICYRQMKRAKDRGETTTSQDILQYEFGTKATESELSEASSIRKEKNKDAWLPFFSFVSISAATKHFSIESKLGEGGFGPVYRGELFNGQEIAVKRLSRRSGQGLEELRNETVLLAELQHRNLVKLLGCCIEQDEKILIYEYMPNKSLDSFLFDPKKRGQLDWTKRVIIIEGIAQGLLYLHQYSRLRIIHRDLKASNILLDNDMNPKISDFGMARMFGGDESFANTNRIVGTYGYMSPEYALEGLFSTKSDVFSFGVLMLEILSGKKNTGIYNSDTLNLISYAWQLWKGVMAVNLMDPMLEGQCSLYNLLRYINVGLLCVEETATDRPTMSEVISMLTSELSILPSPKHPAFSTLRSMENPRPSPSRPETYSASGVNVSAMEGR